MVAGSASGASMTRSVSAVATQGRIHPSAFSSRLIPGHSMRWRTRPETTLHMQVRQVPLRQDLGNRTRAAIAASSNVTEAGAENVKPCGSMRTIGTLGSGGAVMARTMLREVLRSGSDFSELTASTRLAGNRRRARMREAKVGIGTHAGSA